MACQRITIIFSRAFGNQCVLTQSHRSVLGSQARFFGSQTELKPKQHEKSSKYKVVVVGGGSGGCAVAAKFSSLGKQLAIIEPRVNHYYQPIWTLVGAGLKGFQQSLTPMRHVLPNQCEWIKDRAAYFDPEKNLVKLESGEEVHYDYLVVAMGIQLDYKKVQGLREALENDPQVATNFHPRWVNKTFPALQNFKGGNAIFTFPNTPIKCAGAPQKIMYLAEEFFRKEQVRDNTQVMFNTSLGVIFGVKKYAAPLLKIIEDRGIIVNYRHNLVEIKHNERKAVFEKLDENNEHVEFHYDFLHVTPPMSSPDIIKSSALANEAGWVDVDKHTLQHTRFPNVFSLGDCSSLPTSKTAAAVAAQSGILHKNMSAVMAGTATTPLYDGYTSCPLITSSKTCILAEFDYDANPLETLPINQAKERRTSYMMKAYMMPQLYWKIMTKGYWNGPKIVRQLMHLGMSRSPTIKP